MLLPFRPEVRMSMMMSDQCHANPIGYLPIDKVIGKSLQISAMITGFDWMKAVWISGGHCDHPAELCFELIAKMLRNRIVMFQGIRQIVPDGRMEFDSHFLRRASTRRSNSSSLIGWTRPDSISRSRRSTSSISCASDQSSGKGGSELRSASASSARWETGSANTVFSISAKPFMRAG